MNDRDADGLRRLNQKVNEIVGPILADLQQAQLRRQRAAAELDPKAHKLSMVFPTGANYRYWDAGVDGIGRAVRFCWSTRRNAAGYFLTWRELRTKRGKGRHRIGERWRRDQWLARKARWRCKRKAEQRADNLRAHVRELDLSKARAAGTLRFDLGAKVRWTSIGPAIEKITEGDSTGEVILVASVQMRRVRFANGAEHAVFAENLESAT